MIKGVKINMELPADAVNFIDDDKLQGLLAETQEDLPRARELFKKALDKKPLTVEETAVLLAIESEEGLKELFDRKTTVLCKIVRAPWFFRYLMSSSASKSTE